MKSLHRVSVVALTGAWLVSIAFLAVHILGLISSPGISLLPVHCPSATSLRSLCQPVNVRVTLPTQRPPGLAKSASDAVELSGPVEATLSVLNPTVKERFAFEAPRMLAWGGAVGFISPFLVWLVRVRPGGSRGGAPGSETTELKSSSLGLGVAAAVSGSAMVVAGLLYWLVGDWSRGVLASAAEGTQYQAADTVSLELVLTTVLVGVALLAVAALTNVARSRDEELFGLV